MVFQGKWVCSKEFENAKIQNVFHRELEKLTDYDHPNEYKNHHMLMRRSFVLGDLSKAIIRITADDYYKLYINGNLAGQGPTPGYYFNYYYNEIDITPYLTRGENLIALHVYYQGHINRVWNSGDMRQGCIADIIVGDEVVLSTDSTWKYTISKAYTGMHSIAYATQYLEDYDSRLEEKGWNTLEFDDSAWSFCSEKENIDYTFENKPSPMLSIYKLKPQILKNRASRNIVFDFGREITGTLSLIVKGRAGQVIRILCAEELEDDGSFNVRYNMRCNCKYEEFWTLDDGVCAINQYDYKAFRYVQLELDDDIELLNMHAMVRHFKLNDSVCTLETSDEILKSVFELCKNGVRCGTQEVYVDCPTREKGQYAGDLTITSISQLYLSGDPYMYRKAIENQMQSTFITDAIMAVTPGSHMQEIADYSLQFPIIALRYYKHTGDAEFLKETLKTSEKMLAHFNRYARADGLLTEVSMEWNLVDWPDNLRDNYDFPLTKPIGPGCHNVINAFYVGAVGIVEEMKAILGIEFEAEYPKLCNVFNQVFFDKSTGLYKDSEDSTHSALHSNVLPAYFGFYPSEYTNGIAAFILKKGLCCGVYFAYFVLKALANLGRYDDIYNLITSTSENSWYNMVREGGTSCFEAWGKDQKFNTSLCHPWASSPISVLIEDILGITPCVNLDNPTFSPHIPERLEYLKMTVPLKNKQITVLHENKKTSYSIKPLKL